MPKTSNIDPLLRVIVSYRDQPSIAAIKKTCNTKSHFSFKNVEKEGILKELNNLNVNKATQNTDIPTKIIMENSDIFGHFIFSNLNGCINNTSLYPSPLKMTDITPVHKKDSKSPKIITDQLVYCQTSPKCMNGSCLNKRQNILKVFFLNINVDLENVLVLSTVQYPMLEKWKSANGNKKSFGTLLTDLSKAFDCLSHDPLITNNNAYEFNMSAVRFVHSYLKNRMSRTKINSEYSSWKEIMFGIFKDLYLGLYCLIQFYVIYSLLWTTMALQVMHMITRHTPTVNSIEEIIEKSENTSKTLFQWFSANQMKANPDKCHFLFS